MSELKLGVIGPKYDSRTLKLMTVLKALPEIPQVFNVDSQYPIYIPTPMFANDKYGCCVISGRAHMTLRFEAFEQGKLISLTDKNVTDEYFSESGGQDTGLYILDSLKCWRDNGWRLGLSSQIIKSRGCWRKKPNPPINLNSYYVYAFGAIDPKHHEDVKATAYLLNGVYCGVALPNTAKNQVIWSVEGNPDKDADSKRGSWGNHCIFVVAYDNEGLTCITWGGRKRLTWQWWDVYTFDAFGIVDNKDLWLGNESPLDMEKLDNYLKEVSK
jgi:hypothetical protein